MAKSDESNWTIRTSRKVDFEHLPYKAALQSAARNDPALIERLIRVFPNATEQIRGIIKAPVGLHLSHRSTPRPQVLTTPKVGKAVRATTVDRLATSLNTPTAHFSMVKPY